MPKLETGRKGVNGGIKDKEAKFLCYLRSSVFQGFHYTREAVSGIEC
jgi:hypothetical protein